MLEAGQDAAVGDGGIQTGTPGEAGLWLGPVLAALWVGLALAGAEVRIGVGAGVGLTAFWLGFGAARQLAQAGRVLYPFRPSRPGQRTAFPLAGADDARTAFLGRAEPRDSRSEGIGELVSTSGCWPEACEGAGAPIVT